MALPSTQADVFGLLRLQMSVSKRARKTSSDLDQASMSPSEEENSESSSESEKTSDQVSRGLAPCVGGGRMHRWEPSRGPVSGPCSAPFFLPRTSPLRRKPWSGRPGGAPWQDGRNR